VEKLLFNDGLISGRILSGQGDKQGFCKIKFFFFLNANICWKKEMVCQILLFLFFTTIGNLPNIAGVQNNLEKLATIANYSGYKIMYCMVWYGMVGIVCM
jgi:hypothetical protein